MLLGSGNSTTRTQGDGIFDSDWYADSTGSLYVCAGAPGNVNQSVLWKVPISGGNIGTAVQGATVTGTAGASCSPTAMVKNGANEYLYFSVAADGDDGSSVHCSGNGCLYMYKLNDLSSAEQWQLTFAANQNAGGTLLVVDSGNVTRTITGANGASSCTATGGTFQTNTGGAQIGDATQLAACVNLIAGYSASSGGTATVTITRTTTGNVTDTDVKEGVNIDQLNQTAHYNGSLNSWADGNTPRAGIISIGGSGGMVIDNVSSTAGASQVYYGQLGGAGVPGNAVQASQAGLQ
jgi:hypothetical protein